MNRLWSWLYKNIANILTVLRFPLGCLMIWAGICFGPWTHLFFYFFFAACVADNLDGRIARRLKITSEFGERWDPFADKFIQGIIFCFLLAEPRIEFGWKAVIGLLALAEACLIVIRVLGIRNGIRVPSNWFGKLKMGTISAATAGYLFYFIAEAHWGHAHRAVALFVLGGMCVVSLICAGGSFYLHVVQYRKKKRQQLKGLFRNLRQLGPGRGLPQG